MTINAECCSIPLHLLWDNHNTIPWRSRSAATPFDPGSLTSEIGEEHVALCHSRDGRCSVVTRIYMCFVGFPVNTNRGG